MKEPNRKIQELIDHRQQREDQIVSLLAEGKDSAKSLLRAIYPELDKRLKLKRAPTAEGVPALHRALEERFGL